MKLGITMIGFGSAVWAYIAFRIILILQISSNPGFYYANHITSIAFLQEVIPAIVGILLITFGIRRLRKTNV